MNSDSPFGAPRRLRWPSKNRKKMVSQLLHRSPILPRALLPASSLEPLEAKERVLCSFERVRVAAGGADDDEAAAETSAHAAAVGTLHVTSRYGTSHVPFSPRCSERRRLSPLLAMQRRNKERERARKEEARRRTLLLLNLDGGSISDAQVFFVPTSCPLFCSHDDPAASLLLPPHSSSLPNPDQKNRRLVWLPREHSSVGGFEAGFASIVMHALQGGGGGESESSNGDKSSQPPAPAAAVYLQLDDGEGGDAEEADFRGTGEFDDADAGEEEGDVAFEEEEDRLPCPPNDLRLVPLPSSDQASSSPSPASIAKEIFSAMCEAAAMNPTVGEEELEGGEDGDGDDGGFFYDEKEVIEGLSATSLSTAAAARLARYDALLQMPRAEDLDELLDDEEEELGGEDFDEDDEEEEKGGDDDDDGRFDDPEPEAATTTPKA